MQKTLYNMKAVTFSQTGNIKIIAEKYKNQQKS